MDLELKRWKVKLAFLAFLYVFMCGYHEISTKILHSYQKCWLLWSSSQLLHVFVPDFPTLCFGVSLLTECFGVSLLTECFGVSFLTDWRPSSFFSILQVFAGTALWSSRQYRSSGHSATASEMLEIRSPLLPPIHEHTSTHTYTSIYIYIHINAHYGATQQAPWEKYELPYHHHPLAMGWIVSLLFFKDGFDIK